MKKWLLLIVLLAGFSRLAVCQSGYEIEAFAFNATSISAGELNTFYRQPTTYYNQSVTRYKEDFMAVPQWFNLGYGSGGFYVSYWNTHVRALFKPLTEAGNSSGLYIGLYNILSGLEEDDLAGDFGIRGTYFLKNLEDKFNIYGKGEIALVNFGYEDVKHFLPRIGAGVRWRFLYLEVGTGPNPLHGGLCWQWSTRKTRTNK